MTEYIVLCKPKRILLRDTRGNYSLGIKLPTLNYRPKKKAPLTNRQRVKKYYNEHPEKKKERLEYTRQWKKDNPIKVKQHTYNWFLRNRKKANRLSLEYYYKNKGKPEFKKRIAAWRKQYYIKNRDKILKLHKEYSSRPEVKEHKRELSRTPEQKLKKHLSYLRNKKSIAERQRRYYRQRKKKSVNSNTKNDRKTIK